MSVFEKLTQRSNGCCEFCGNTDGLSAYTVEAGNSTKPEENVLVCSVCLNQIDGKDELDANHWRCLNECMWSEVPAVQVVSWRMLQRLKSNDWATDLLEMLYLEDETLQWAKATGEGREKEESVKHIDSNGVVLENGDTVVLIKDLDVKGAGFTAKRGTSVRNLRLVHDNPEQIEGKINGQGIMILTQYVKK